MGTPAAYIVRAHCSHKLTYIVWARGLALHTEVLARGLTALINLHTKVWPPGLTTLENYLMWDTRVVQPFLEALG